MHGQHKQFTNVRVRIQRIGDIKAYYGWVEDYQPGYVSVWLAESEEIRPGQRFYFEIYGMENSVVFEGIMEGYADARPAVNSDPGDKNSEVCYGFQISGGQQVQPPKEDCRRFVGSLKAAVLHRQDEWDCQLIDISPQGAGMRMPIRPRIGDLIRLKVRVPGRLLLLGGHVRYARRDVGQPEMFRVGVRFDVISEEDRFSWNDIVWAA